MGFFSNSSLRESGVQEEFVIEQTGNWKWGKWKACDNFNLLPRSAEYHMDVISVYG